MKQRWLLTFLTGNLLLCLWVFRGALWGQSLLAPLDILPAICTKYHFMNEASSGIPANQFVLDQVTYDLPIQTTIYRAYRAGEIPWWDPFTWAGKPLLAEAHINGTEPIRVLAYLTLPFELAYNWTRVLNYFFSGLAMLMLLRHWKFAGSICVLLALAYEFAGGFVLHFGHPWIQAQFNYYPLVWLAWEAWFRKPNWWSIPLGTLAVGGVFNAGNLQSHAYLVLFSGAILLGYGGRSLANWKKILPVVAGTGLLGMALACPVLLGQIELFTHRTRSIGLKVESNAFGGFGTLATFYPWALGTFRTLDLGKFVNSSNMGFYLFIGPAGILAALFAACQRSRREELSPVRRTALWLVVAYLGIVCTPLVNLLYTRSAGLGVLGVSALAALGIEKLFAMTQPVRRWGRLIVIGLVFIVIGTNVASLVIYPKFIPKIRQMVNAHVAHTTTGTQEAGALHEFQINNFGNEVSLKNPETVCASLGILLFAGVCMRPELRRQKWTLPCLLALNLLPPVMFARRFVPVQPIGLWHRLMADDSEPRRIAGILNARHLRVMEVSRITFEGLYPNAMAHYFQVHNLLGYSSLQPPNFGILPPDRLKPLLPQAADYVYESLVLGAAMGELKKNPTPGLARFQWAEGASREIYVKRETMNALVLELGAGAEADLIRTDTFFPGWSASVDGKTIPIVRAAPFFSRIKIPAGAQTLTLRYTPTYLRLGLILSAISLLTTGVLTFLAARITKGRSLTA